MNTDSSDSPPPNLSSSTSHGATYSMPPSSMGSRLLGDLGPASTYAMNRPGFPPLMSHEQDLPGYSTFNPPQRPHVPLGPTFPPQMQSYNPTIPGLPLDQGSRSSNMGPQDGPPFEDTKVIYPVITARNQQLTPKIDAKIQKGFFKVDQKWTCYRRNYFTVSCSFSLKPVTYEPQVYLRRPGSQQHEQVNFFAMQISAKTAMVNNQGSESRNLIQHTPKRDRATESVPDKVILQPAQPSILANSGSYHGSSTMYGTSSNVPSSMMADYNPQQYISAQHQGHPHSHTFERIQFQKATANNGKRRAQQQYFHVVVKLFADVGRHGDLEWVEIATSQSHPMVVRGRSPGHYKDNRRDSSTSMDPDRGAGGGGDGSGGAPSMGSYLGPPHGRSSTMDWESSHRNSSHIGGSYRRTAEDCSSTSAASVESSSSSCCEPGLDFQSVEAAMNPSSNLVPTCIKVSGSVDRKAFTPFLGLGSYRDTRNLKAQRSQNQPSFVTGTAKGLGSLRSVPCHSKRTGDMEIQLHQTLCPS